MRRLNFLKGSIALQVTLLFIIHGCGPEKSKEEIILGQWNAFWETRADDNMSEISAEHLRMNGILNFMEDGKVEIAAYGFQGCIFSDDTLQNTLSWKLDDSVLRFIDQGDEHGLPYTIQKFTSNELRLTLLEDINLTLSRN